MSTVFDIDGMKHWVSHVVRDDQPADLVKVVAHTYCRLVRIFQRGNALLEEDAPTCFVCIDRQRIFAQAEQVMRDADNAHGLERFHHMFYGDDGEAVPP